MNPSVLSRLDPAPSTREPVTQELPAHPAVGPLVLVLSPPEGPVTTLTLRLGTALVLGASADADVHVADPTVSRRHCAVTHRGSGLEVEDLGSKNGTWLAGARVPRALVGPDRGFTVGRTRIEVAWARPRAEVGGEVAPLPGLVGASRPMRELAARVRRVARMQVPALVLGESGAGKELVARALHRESRRAAGPWVTLNAASLSAELTDSELFGHVRGAFTGAVRERAGAFREARGGTLFIDEVGALGPAAQAKLLRAVEEGRVRPVGAECTIPVDVRLVTATCEPLERAVRLGTFRADLFERLAVGVVRVPALRERPEDIPALARHLLTTCELADRTLSAGGESLLSRQAWEGNVRALRNVLVQAALVATDRRLTAADVARVLAERAAAGAATPSRPRRPLSAIEAAGLVRSTNGNVSAAARRAGVPRSTLRDLLRAHDAAGSP